MGVPVVHFPSVGKQDARRGGRRTVENFQLDADAVSKLKPLAFYFVQTQIPCVSVSVASRVLHDIDRPIKGIPEVSLKRRERTIVWTYNEREAFVIWIAGSTVSTIGWQRSILDCYRFTGNEIEDENHVIMYILRIMEWDKWEAYLLIICEVLVEILWKSRRTNRRKERAKLNIYVLGVSLNNIV